MTGTAGPLTSEPTGCASSFGRATSSSAARRPDGAINPDAVLQNGEICRRPPLSYGRQETGTDRRGVMRPEINLMKRVLLLAASALVLTAFVPEQADAQGRHFGVRGGVVR